MSEQGNGDEDGVTEDTAGQQSTRWMIPAIVVLAVAIVTVSWFASQAGEAQSPILPTQGATHTVAISGACRPEGATSPTITPTPTLTPEPTQSDAVDPDAAPHSLFALPTVTPTLVPGGRMRQRVDVSGSTLLSLVLSNTDFRTSGRPLPISLESRTFLLDTRNLHINDRWCQQLGPFHLVLELNLSLDPTDRSVAAFGNVSLVEDFCHDAGEARDVATIGVKIPANASTNLTANLEGNKYLLNMPGLFDTETQTDFDLTISNISE